MEEQQSEKGIARGVREDSNVGNLNLSILDDIYLWYIIRKFEFYCVLKYEQSITVELKN